MDTKSRKSEWPEFGQKHVIAKAFWGWFCRLAIFAGLVWAVFLIVFTGPMLSGIYSTGYLTDVLDPFRPLGETAFVQQAFDSEFIIVVQNLRMADDDYCKELLSRWGDGISYYVKNDFTGSVYTNNESGGWHPPEGRYVLAYYFENGVFTCYRDGKIVRTQSITIDRVHVENASYDVLPRTVPYDERQQWVEQRFTEHQSMLMNTRAYFFVASDLGGNSDNQLYANIRNQIWGYRAIFYGILIVILAFLTAAILLRRHKKTADRAIAGVMSRVWLEVKLFALFWVVLGCGLILLDISNRSFDRPFLLSPLIILYLFLQTADLRFNKSGVLKHNIAISLVRLWRRITEKKSFQKRMWLDFIGTAVLEVILLSFFLLFLIGGANSNHIFMILFALLLFAAAICTLILFLMRYSRLVSDLGRFVDHMAELENGRYGKTLTTDRHAVLYPVINSVGNIQDGFVTALQKATKAERMRVELVTNVSHDLKTPLTSIISYVELLSQMELPQDAREHVEVLAFKSERLKTLIQDLFELSKTSSGELELQTETLDLARLVEQTLPDPDAGKEQNVPGPVYKVKLSDRPLWISVDGAKLSRVLSNLTENAEKYSMPGTRIYINACRRDKQVALELKNTANYEMTFEAEQVAERFFRGDQARSTEGSGLGLAIARSFTEACGGRFSIDIEGDMFKVMLEFPYNEHGLPPAVLENYSAENNGFLSSDA